MAKAIKNNTQYQLSKDFHIYQHARHQLHNSTLS